MFASVPDQKTIKPEGGLKLPPAAGPVAPVAPVVPTVLPGGPLGIVLLDRSVAIQVFLTKATV
jgi:hypothetical protein